MRIEAIRPRELTDEQVALWESLAAQSSPCVSPFLRPEFTLAVAAVRSDVEVALLEQDQRLVGFFPFQRGAGGRGQPVGSRLNDLHGVICEPHVELCARTMVRALRLRRWDYHQMCASQRHFAAHHYEVQEAVYMDLSAGYEAYYESRRRAGSDKLKQLAKKTRRLEREVGPVRLVAADDSRDALEQLLAWKSAQYRRTGAADVFSLDWVVRLVQRVLAMREPEFCGMLTALYVGPRLAALELGLRSGPVLHGWFPAYSPDFAVYSPGLLLTNELAKQAPSLGLQRLDLGKNNLAYKASFASAGYSVAKGCVAAGAIERVSRSVTQCARRWARESWWARPLRLARELVRPVAAQQALR